MRILDDILEGEYTETGGSYLLRLKLHKFTDIFSIFGNSIKKVDSVDTSKPFVIQQPDMKEINLRDK